MDGGKSKRIFMFTVKHQGQFHYQEKNAGKTDKIQNLTTVGKTYK